MKVIGFWRNLRQRRIIQILLTYLAGGWIVLTVIDQLANNEVLPTLAYQLALVLFLAGIPAALVVGWYHGEKGAQQVSRMEVGLLSLVLLVGLAAGTLVVYLHGPDGPAFADEIASELDARSLAVLYFRDATPGEDLQYVADGLTEALIDQLSAVPALSVVSRNGSEAVRHSDLALDSVARLLDAGTLIRGSVERRGESLRVQVGLVDGGSGEEFQRGSFERPAGELLTVRDELASEVSRLLRQWLGAEVRLRERREGTGNVAAWALLQRAERATKEAEARLDAHDVEEALERYRRADSLLAEAEAADTAWVEPIVLRGRIAYERSTLSHDARQALEGLNEASGHAQRALALAPNHPRALELRGTARYSRWLFGAEPDPERSRALLRAAKEDLESAVRRDPTLARAYSVLSHLYYQPGEHEDLASVVLAARRAYEQDAYLRAVDGVLWRLYSGSYDLQQHAQARRWCEEGHRRFPRNFRFVECQLWLMTLDGVEPDVARAWELVREYEELVPRPQREFYVRRAHVAVGGVIARAGLQENDAELLDSARSVMVGARAGQDVDPELELLSFEAAMRVILGDREEAIDLLRRYEAANPGHFARPDAPLHWWWRPLQDHPEFQRLRTAGY